MTALTLTDFNIGDRVEVVDYEITERKPIYLNQLGTVVGFDKKWIFVDHDEKFSTDLDTCGGMVKSGCGWIYHPKELGLINQSVATPVDDLL